MNTTRTNQAQRNQTTAGRSTAVATISLASMSYAPSRVESIHSDRDGHWAVYMFVALACLAGTILISSTSAQLFLDRLSQ